jgi:hypothetical protein
MSLAIAGGSTILMLKARDKAGDGNILVLHLKKEIQKYTSTKKSC